MKHFTLILISLLLVLAGCETTGRGTTTGNENVVYNPLVSAFTSGVVSSRSNVVVRFAEGVNSLEELDLIADNVLSISPRVDGKIQWSDERTLMFIPNKPLSPATNYEVTLDLDALFKSESESNNEFKFSFQTIKPSARIELDAALPESNSNETSNTVRGKLIFSDHIANSDIEPKMKVTQEGQNKDVLWDEGNDGRTFSFTVKNIERTDLSTIVRASLDGDRYNMDEVTSELVVPSAGTFGMHSYKINSLPNQVIEIAFSDILDQSQNLNGLITFNRQINFESEIYDNIIKLYPRETIVGDVELTLHTGITNAKGKKMQENQMIFAALEEAKPAIEFIGKGTILPNSDGLTLPFRAVSLNKVQVRIIKIFENNIISFLRDNTSFNGSYNLRHAGRLILKKTISLNADNTLDIHTWNTFSIDLDKLISLDPSSLYRVELVFGMQHAVYPGIQTSEIEDYSSDQVSEDEIRYFDTQYGGNYYGDLGGYGNWSERDDPTKKAYYSSDRFASRNVFASNLGIIAKSGNTNQISVTISDLRTVEPLSDVEVTLFNMQEQEIVRGTTNSEGMLTLATESKPYMLSAKTGDESGYLILDDGTSLQMSNFDVSGSLIQDGLKGFLYGERGVWRPGDDIQLSFMLEDRERKLPKGHPVLLEVFNSLGQNVYRNMNNISDNNESNHLFAFTIPTEHEAPTGNWNAKVTVGGTSFEKRLRVESIKPNRLKIEMQYANSLINANSPILSGTIASRWLHGAPAADLRSKIEGKLYAKKTIFKGYEKYNFDNEALEFKSEEFTLFEGTLDNSGQVSFKKEIPTTNTSPGLLTMQVRSRVFETGGDFSTNISTIDYSPYTSYIGIKPPTGDEYGVLLTDENHKIELVALQESGTPIGGRRNVNYKIYKIDWRWWWEKSEDNLARYISSSSNHLIKEGTVALSNGTGAIDFMIKQPEWGRYLFVVNDAVSGHTTSATVKIDWPGYAFKSSNSETAASMLSVTSDKEEYNVGEKAQLTFASSEGGRALISIENGTKVLKQFWAPTTKDYTNYSFELDQSMSPNAYAHITLLQPHAQTKNNLPIRMYGVVPIIVNDESTRLSPAIEMPQTLEPNSEVTIRVSEKDGKPMSYTLAIVEEGLLDLTNFVTPKPYDHFYAREALGVKTWDIYNSVMGAYGGRVESIFGIGGSDELLNDSDPAAANRFDPVSIVLGPFSLKSGQTEKHKITIPNYIGSVRTMVVACADQQYGSAEETSTVKSPLMALATLPRMVSIGEEFNLPVTLFTDGNAQEKIDISVSTDGLIDIVGNKTKSVNSNSTGSTMAFFRLASKNVTGVEKIKVSAKSGSHTSTYEIEIGIRNPNSPITTSTFATLQAGEKANIPFETIGATGTDQLWIETSSIAPIDFDRRLKYLQSYPHSCVEQTISAAFPLLYAEQFCDLSSDDKAEIDKKIIATLSKLQRYTTPDGGFAYWAGETNANSWATSYAGHFLIEAAKKGYTPPTDLLSPWMAYQNKTADTWQDSPTINTIVQTYRLYTLALADKPNQSAMNRTLSSKHLSTDAAATLATAYAHAGRADVAQKISLQARESNQPEYQYSFGSHTRSLALMLLYTDQVTKNAGQSAQIVKQLSDILSSETWMNTQDIAFSMLSLASWIPSKGDAMKISYKTPNAEKVNINTQQPIYLRKATEAPTQSGTVEFQNNGNSTIFARVITQGTPTAPLTEEISQNLSIKAEYKDLVGKTIDLDNIVQGTDFMAVVTVTHPGVLGKYTNLSLTHLIPSGWEIRNMRMESSQLPYKGNKPRYQDVRDDKVLSYFDLDRGDTMQIVLLLNAAYEGRFSLPSISCSAMYDNQIQATTATGTTSTVKR